MSGKGDDYRPVDFKKWCDNYDKISWKDEDSNSKSDDTPLYSIKGEKDD
jgi:hypothetical protein